MFNSHKNERKGYPWYSCQASVDRGLFVKPEILPVLYIIHYRHDIYNENSRPFYRAAGK